MSAALILFLGALSGALASALFRVLAVQAGDQGLARATAATVVFFLGAATVIALWFL